MTTPDKVLLSMHDPALRAELAREIAALNLHYETCESPTRSAASALAASPQVVIFDQPAFDAFAPDERAVLRKSGVELMLVYRDGQTRRIAADAVGDVSDFIALPVDRAALNTLLQRAFRVSRLREQLFPDSIASSRDSQRTRAPASDLARLKSNLITIISHEFKTPIHLASGYARLLTDGSLGEMNEKQREALETIQKQFARLNAKLQDIERIAQLEMGLPHHLTELVDIAVLLENEIKGFEEAITAKSLALSFDAPHGLPPVQGNQDFLSDVFRRLIDNAIHYTGVGGNINIRACGHREKNADGIRVIVSDSGKGIPASLLPHIFERFGEFRDIEHHSSRRSGLGLGLAICRHLVELHGGTIIAESESTKGSSFKVFLPGRT